MAWLRDRLSPPTLTAVRQLTALASELDCTTAQLAIAWVLRRKEVSSVITGATTLHQLDENLAAVECAETLSEETIDQIFRIISPVADSKS
jgi:aryl-alcohol dehydrogenase-like predicted oxidoreductase